MGGIEVTQPTLYFEYEIILLLAKLALKFLKAPS
jgi:hypothetical protein